MFAATRALRNALVVAEHAGGSLTQSSLAAVTAASHFGDVTMLIAGTDCKTVAEEASSVEGVKNVILSEESSLANGLAENLSKAVVSVIKSNGKESK
jgi:electron transfer flavoprotein alpha subunit